MTRTIQTKQTMKMILAAAGAVLLTSTAAFANMTGTSVTGVFTPYGGGYLSGNYFDPAFLAGNYPSGSVPAGSANIASPTVTIGAGDTKFGFVDEYNNDTADFNAAAGTLTVTDVMHGFGALPWNMIFTDSAFTGITTHSNNFYGGIAASISGDAITLNWLGTYPVYGGGGPYTATYTAVFSVSSSSSSSVPDGASTVALLGLASAGLAGLKRFKAVTA
jgi:hypothetical protein